jgi:hypothetical protein
MSCAKETYAWTAFFKVWIKWEAYQELFLLGHSLFLARSLFKEGG